MLAMQAEPQALFPEKLEFLFEPHRYKVAYGGRGAAKSWGFGRASLIIGSMETKRIVCAREIQKSIADSVHQLLQNQIKDLRLSHFYRVTDTYIEGKNDTLFTFHGLHHNVENIKSLEGCDICWVEEANKVSKSSWNKLIPTVRKDGSEIWATFNPELESDEAYQMFVVRPPKNARVVKIDWRDNPWFPKVLREEMATLRGRSEDEYMHVYEGHCKQMLEGAIYAHEIRRAQQEGRFTRVPWDASKPVDVIYDLGRADMTTMWFRQRVGFEARFIDYYQSRGYALAHYLKVLSEKPYHYGKHHMPHDADNELLASELTIRQQMEAAGHEVSIVPKLPIVDGINAGRTLFSRAWFDADKCADGINALKRYTYDVDPDTKQYSKNPKHDDASHGADGYRYAAVTDEEEAKAEKGDEPGGYSEHGWMG